MTDKARADALQSQRDALEQTSILQTERIGELKEEITVLRNENAELRRKLADALEESSLP